MPAPGDVRRRRAWKCSRIHVPLSSLVLLAGRQADGCTRDGASMQFLEGAYPAAGVQGRNLAWIHIHEFRFGRTAFGATAGDGDEGVGQLRRCFSGRANGDGKPEIRLELEGDVRKQQRRISRQPSPPRADTRYLPQLDGGLSRLAV